MSDFFTAYGRNQQAQGRLTQLGMQIFNMRQAKEEMKLKKEQLGLQKEQMELQKEDMFHKVIAPYYQAIANAQGSPAEIPETTLKATGRPLTQKVQTPKAVGAGPVPRGVLIEEEVPYSVEPMEAAGGWSPDETTVLNNNFPLVRARSVGETGTDDYLFNVLLGVNRNTENPKKETMAMLSRMESDEQTKLTAGKGSGVPLVLDEDVARDILVESPHYKARVETANPGDPDAAYKALMRLSVGYTDVDTLKKAINMTEDNVRADIEKGVQKLKLNVLQRKGMVDNYTYLAQASLETYDNQETWFDVEAEEFTSYEAFKKYVILMEKLYMQKAVADRKMKETAPMDPAVEWVRKDYKTIHNTVGGTFRPAQGFIDIEGNFSSLDYENSYNLGATYEAIKFMWSALVKPARIQAKSGTAYAREMMRQINSFVYEVGTDAKGNRHQERVYFETLEDLYPVITKEDLADNPIFAEWLLDLLPNGPED